MKYIKKGLSFLKDPGNSFDAEKTTGLNDAFKYLLVLAIITSVLSALVAVFWTSFASSFIPSGSIPPEAAGFMGAPFIFMSSLVLGYVGLVIGSFIWGLWLHLWVYLAGARKGLEQTMKSVFYGGTPNYLLGWIPLINLIAFIWSLVLTGMGIVRYQETTGGKAAIAIIIALIIPLVIALALFAALLAALIGSGMIPPGSIPGF